jgi:DNA ligase-1
MVVKETFAAKPGTGIEGVAIGGLLCDYEGVEIRVGTGFSEAEARRWFEHPEEIVSKVVEVGFNQGATGESGKKRHPSLKRVRDPMDKSEVK